MLCVIYFCIVCMYIHSYNHKQNQEVKEYVLKRMDHFKDKAFQDILTVS